MGRIFAKPLTFLGRNIADSYAKRNQERNIQVRPKSEKFRTIASDRSNDPACSNFIQRNLDEYIYSLTNFELKEKLESCPGNLVDCPVLNDFREGLKKSLSNHINITARNENRVCQSSRLRTATRSSNDRENFKNSKPKSNESEDKRQPAIHEVKPTPSNTSRGVIRSTRAQDLRSQSNRDLLKPKTTNEKPKTASPYVAAWPQRKKKNSAILNSNIMPITRSNTTKSEDQKKQLSWVEKNSKSQCSNKEKGKKEKSSSAGEVISLQRQKTQEIIHPKIVKKKSLIKVAGGTGATGSDQPQLKKSNTFFICKGTKNGGGDNESKEENGQNDSPSEGNVTDDDLPSPKVKPLTHNDSFCLIVKSSQNWSQKNRSDDEKWLHYGLAYEERGKRSDKGILKNSNNNLKSVDSLEKVDSEKIVRFSDELLESKKVLRKLLRRKKRLQNFFTPSWYQKNKLFQKYLEILREKSVLVNNQNESPDNPRPLVVPIQMRKRYKAETFGLYPRRGKTVKSHMKDAYSY